MWIFARPSHNQVTLRKGKKTAMGAVLASTTRSITFSTAAWPETLSDPPVTVTASVEPAVICANPAFCYSNPLANVTHGSSLCTTQTLLLL